ncbi:MAG: phosphoadenosine phosphosulfate reductase family protein, partial [Chitinivibrionales bacterium]|nr:phosphoadenosine phosphosulfate reductase family protein [Chitinivibrionales bacterium]
TGWEAQETYDYLDELERRLGVTIERVGVEGGMVARAEYRHGFPARMQRWCTRELKLEPLKEFHEWLAADRDAETVSITGVRAGESPKRALFAAWEDDETWDGYVWRPLLNWKVEDVLQIHTRHDVPVNPLYQAGFDRVGCWPCIFSSKHEIQLLSEYAPERIASIARLERRLTESRRLANAERPGRYSLDLATFFQTRGPGGGGKAMGIEEVVDWSRTTYGGRQLPMFNEPPSGGCFRWGLCEVPPAVLEEDEND